MLRYPAIVWALFKSSVQNEAAYRVNALVQAALSALWVSVSVVGVLVVYGHTETIRGWSQLDTLALLGVFVLMGGLINTFITPNLGWFAGSIRDGALDFVLLKPANSQFLISFGRVIPWGLGDVIAGLVILAYALPAQLVQGAGVWRVLAFAVATGAGAVIVYSLWMSFATIAFWTVSIDNLSALLTAFYSMGRFPVDAYPGWMRWMLTFVVPIAFVTTVPIQALKGRLAPLSLLGAVLLAALTLWISTRLWRLGLSRYTSASS